MRYLILLMMIAGMAGVAQSQSDGEWWTVHDWGLDYRLPGSWSSDPFSTSSVCDCPGTINDNGGWDAADYLGMVIYPTTTEERSSPDRQQVWGSEFKPASPTDTVKHAGIAYKSTYGTMEGLRLGEKAWKLVSIGKTKRKHKHLTIYFFGNPDLFDKNQELFDQILASMKRKRVR